MAHDRWKKPAHELLRVNEGFRLEAFDATRTPGWKGGSPGAVKYMKRQGVALADLQERLFADGRSGGHRSVLLVLQGMDGAGKGGIVRHVIGLVDPQAVQHHAFGPPTRVELSHNYLWRIRRALPTPGALGVFDRSQYEDVLVVRVHDLVPEAVWSKRYDEINAFEAKAAEAGTVIVKVALIITPDEQKRRLGRRLRLPDKYWKYKPRDLDERALWPAYRDAYQAVFDKTSTDVAPWYVIPANEKWYARLAVTELLLEAFETLDLGWPPPAFDVEAEKARLAES
jgi:PPK2 family polyphosphate:nucleotide phosphotransferase